MRTRFLQYLLLNDPTLALRGLVFEHSLLKYARCTSLEVSYYC